MHAQCHSINTEEKAQVQTYVCDRGERNETKQEDKTRK